ncbi:MAG: metallophosphoesterase [Weeksellaceae bacterium]|nr:metallophosphoesterase [Weeksellaceae bacterium]
MDRRSFLKSGAAAGLLMTTPLGLADVRPKVRKLTILHTNDQHSRIEPFEVSDNERTSNRGGFARRSALINKIRTEEENVLLLDSGDIFQGTPYFNFFGGELEFRLMSKMGYAASTIGNHEFDNGLKGLKDMLPHADFDFVISNYDFSNTMLDGEFLTHKIMQIQGLRVGMFGLGVQLDGLVSESLSLETKYLDPYEIAQDMVSLLQAKRCDLIICLSHIGYDYRNDSQRPSDLKLAKRVPGIDLILGGHTHTFLEQADRIVRDDGSEVLVNQVGWAGLYLGRIDVHFGNDGRKKYLTQALAIDEAFTQMG